MLPTMSDPSNDKDYLLKTIENLTSLLHQYQDSYPPIEPAATDVVQVVPPWNIDEHLVSPLIREYEQQISTLSHDADKYKSLYKETSSQVSEMVEENQRLTAQLENALTNQLGDADYASGAVPDASDEPEYSVIENLQQQLRLATYDRDRYSDLCRASKLEVERLEQEVNELRRSHISSAHWQRLQQEHDQTKLTFTTSMERLHAQVSEWQVKADGYRQQAELADQRLEELLRQANRQKQSLRTQEKNENLKVDETVKHLENQLTERTNQITSLKIEIDSLNDLVEAQMEQLRLLSAAIPEKERRIEDLRLRMQETVETAEGAVIEKTEMALAVQNYQGEVDRLRAELSTLCEEAGKKTSEEVDKLNSYNQQKMDKLEDTIHSLQMENGTTKAELERVTSEKRSVEDELSKLYQQGTDQAYQNGGRFDVLSKRACLAESERDEIKLKLSLLQAELKKTEMSSANDKLSLQRKIDTLEERVLTLQKDFNAVNVDRLRHLEEAREAQEETTRIRLEAEAAARKHNKEVTCLEYSLKIKQSEVENKLRGSDDSHRSVIERLRSEINRQQKSENRWKEEYDSLLSKMDKSTNQLRLEVKDKEGRIKELSSMLCEARDRTCQAEEMMRDYTNQMRKVEQRTKDTEMRLSDALTQLSRKESKIRQLMANHRDFETRLSMSISNTAAKDELYGDGTFRLSDIHDPIPTHSAHHVLADIPLNTIDRENYQS